MKTCCPGCQTIFRVTSEQLKARAGRVRCGQCRKVFNALESLLDDAEPVVVAAPPTASGAPPAPEALLPTEAPLPTEAASQMEMPPQSVSSEQAAPAPAVAVLLREEGRFDESEESHEKVEKDEATDADGERASTSDEPPGRAEPFFAAHALDPASDGIEHATPHSIVDGVARSNRSSTASKPPAITTDQAANGVEIGDTEHGLLPRENKEAPGYDRWLEGAISQPTPPVIGQALAAPFVIVIVLLVLTLIGQTIFHFRGVIALTAPSTRPALAALSAALGTDIPLPRHVDLVSIEASDLQNESGRNKLLTLQATLHNRASYAQAYPAIELTLTDIADKPIVRRVFMPDEYLTPAQLAEKSFGANADVEVRLWLDASEVKAAGYRLYVFYP